METFMTILFVLSIALIIIASAVVAWLLAILVSDKSIDAAAIWVIAICTVVGFGGYFAAVKIDGYQAEMKVGKFKATCVLEGSEGRFDATKKNMIIRIDGDIEVELTGADWTMRIGDEMLNAASLPKCAGASK